MSSLRCLPLLSVWGNSYEYHPPKWHEINLWGYPGTWDEEEEMARDWWKAQRILSSVHGSPSRHRTRRRWARTRQEVCGFGCRPRCLCGQLSRLFLGGFVIAGDPHQEATEPG